MSLTSSRLSIILVCLLASGAAALADPKLARTNLSAAQIVEKHIAARGGPAAWRAVQSISWTGKMDAGGGDSVARAASYLRTSTAPIDRKKIAAAVAQQNQKTDEIDRQVQLPFRLTMQRPRRTRLELDFAGKTAVQVFDGTHGWKLRPFLNRNDVEPFTADELNSQSTKPDLDGPLMDYTARGSKIELESVEAVEGKDAYKLKLTAKGGAVQHIWIDAQSFLDVKFEGQPRRMDGRMHPVYVYQRDFRSVQGVMIPFLMETAVDGYRTTHKVFIEKVAVNPQLNAAWFGKPQA